eukprot:TRINITY_DN1096_c0_g2_i1.p1 TRINITY_DN1096_c0_g2~~TRINITY_DN1096_c0_g2_i1.p1  ORF type:complete len:184 (+),score=43.60 TRINITY_DN1096_c0_g2_i1:474-1025(+)
MFLEVVALGEKRRIQQHLENYAQQGKITYTIFITGIFFDWGIKTGFLDFNLKTQEVALYDEGKNKFAGTNLDTIGQFVAASLKHPELSANKRLKIANFLVTQLEVLHSLEKATGKKWTVKERTTFAELKKQIPLLEKGEGHRKSILSVIYGGAVDYPLDDNKLFPEVNPLTLDQSVELLVKDL